MATYLLNKSFIHFLIAQDTLLLNKASIAQYFIPDQYAKTVFQGIILDTSVVKVSIAEKSQFKTLQYEMPKIKLDITCTNRTIICLESKMPLSSISIVQVLTPIGTTNFYIVDILILFLFCLKNMDTLSIYLNNIINQLIYQDVKSISIFCK